MTVADQTSVTPGLPTRSPTPAAEPGGHRVRLLSYNIQSGLATGAYREYVTKGWRYLLPHAERTQNLHRIAQIMRGFDIIGVQESDAGSLRTAFLNQTEFLARHAGLPFWYEQVNRRIGRVARHSNGLISRIGAREVHDWKLPGAPGRGVLLVRFGGASEQLALVVAHLALGRRGRAMQLGFIGELVRQYPHAIVMGDFNCDLDSEELRAFMRLTGLETRPPAARTFPSWRPHRRIDHILVTPEIAIDRTYVPPARLSDHLPVAMEVRVPAAVDLYG